MDLHITYVNNSRNFINKDIESKNEKIFKISTLISHLQNYKILHDMCACEISNSVEMIYQNAFTKRKNLYVKYIKCDLSWKVKDYCLGNEE